MNRPTDVVEPRGLEPITPALQRSRLLSASIGRCRLPARLVDYGRSSPVPVGRLGCTDGCTAKRSCALASVAGLAS